MNSKIVSLLCMTVASSCVFAQGQAAHEHHNHADHAYGPVGVMGGHPHKQGEWMLSYRYSTMLMRGNRSGGHDVRSSEVLNDFMVSPTEMTMQMHMFGLMYGVNDKVTLMAMVPYTKISMDHLMGMGMGMTMKFSTKSEGMGDAKFSGIYTLHETGNRKVLLNAGISLPTGSIDKRDDTPAGPNMKLPYPMQLGSGTYDLLPGITYTDQLDDWSWGSQLKATFRLGENDNDYRLGDDANLTAWVARKLSCDASVSLRLDGKKWGNIHGANPELNPMMVPTARTDLRGGERVDLLLGVDLFISEGKLKDNRVAIEVGVPVYQQLDGPQLETDLRLTIGWQVAF